MNLDDFLELADKNYFGGEEGKEQQGFFIAYAIALLAQEVRLTRETLLDIFSTVDFSDINIREQEPEP